MTTQVIVRGSTVQWTTTFYDADDVVTNPSGAKLYVSYRRSRAYQTDTVAMTPGAGSTWVATWDSAVADRGQVDWHIRTDDSPTSADENSFELDTNKANPSV